MAGSTFGLAMAGAVMVATAASDAGQPATVPASLGTDLHAAGRTNAEGEGAFAADMPDETGGADPAGLLAVGRAAPEMLAGGWMARPVVAPGGGSAMSGAEVDADGEPSTVGFAATAQVSKPLALGLLGAGLIGLGLLRLRART